MPRIKTSIQLSPETMSILEHVESKGAYIESLIESRWAEWQEALSILHQAGWTVGALGAACDILNGTWISRAYPVGSFLALELCDGERLNQTASEKHGVDSEHWQTCIRQVREHEPTAWALLVCVREFWAGHGQANNRAFERLAFGGEGYDVVRSRERVGRGQGSMD